MSVDTVILGIQLDAIQAELTQSAIDLLEAGYPSSVSQVIQKMGKLGYDRGLVVLHQELTRRGFPSLACEALTAIGTN